MSIIRMILVLGALVLMAHRIGTAQTITSRTLNGEWLFRSDSAQAGLHERWYDSSYRRTGWKRVTVPEFWENIPGMANYDGWGWYAKSFTFKRTGEPMSIHFGGVDDDAIVWLNGVRIGTHSGYTEAFTFDVTNMLRDGENVLVIQVIDFGGGGGIYKPITLVDTKHLDDVVKSAYAGQPALKSADWVKDAVIYEVYLRSFSSEGTFAALEKRIPELKNLGVTVVWLMPIHPVGVKNRKGTLGSPYSVRDYYATNPEFGTIVDFQKLLRTVHNNGMKLIIDLVANHTAWDSKLLQQHPEWFMKDSSGKIVSPNKDWTDVADLDYSKTGLRKYMLDMMDWWVRDIGIDGFRCDVSELVPLDFWEAARKRLNAIKPVMMLSEGALPEHHLNAFDLTYSWNVYDLLESIVKEQRSPAVLDTLMQQEALTYPKGSLRMRFNTNHDKNAWDAPAISKFGREGLALTAVLINTMPGVPLLYNGEEVANDKKLSLFEKVDIDWSRPRTMDTLYRTLFRIRKEHKALSRGDLVRVPTATPRQVYSFFRIFGSDRVLVLLNFSDKSVATTLQLPEKEVFAGRKKLTMKETFAKASLVLENGKPLPITIPAHGYQVYVMQK